MKKEKGIKKRVEIMSHKKVFNELAKLRKQEDNKYNFITKSKTAFKAKKGYDKELIHKMSDIKKEPEWMREIRLNAFKVFQEKPLPDWGPDLSKIDFNEISYFIKPKAKNTRNWKDVPKEIKETFDKLGIPKAEQKYLAGSVAQYESDAVYHNIKKQWEDKGVLFMDMDTAMQKHPEIIKEYFMKAVPITDNKFSALHASVWSGGSFLYVPKGVEIDLPLQTYFRMNSEKEGQFEHTIIVAEEGSKVHYIEGCTAPKFSDYSLHSAVVEIYVKDNAKVRYTTVQNWSKNVYNLNTKRALVGKNAKMEWVGGSLGCLTKDSKVFTNPSGPVNISEIKKGESVFSLNEKTKQLEKHKVNGIIFTGNKEVFEIETAGRKLEATANHPFLVLEHEKVKENKRKGKFTVNWKPLEELKEGSLIAVSKKIPEYGVSFKLPEINIENRKAISKNQYVEKFEMSVKHLYKNITFPKETNEDLMWLFGLYIGDGSTWTAKNKNKSKIVFSTPKTDGARDELIKVIKKYFKCNPQINDKNITINSAVIAEVMKKIGFKGIAKTKKIPEWVFSLPQKQRLALIAGFIDSDGHIQTGNIYITSINKKLLEQTKTLSLSCGINSSRVFKHGNKGKVKIKGIEANAQESFRIMLSGKNINEIKIRNIQKKKKFKKQAKKFRIDFNSSEGLNFASKTNDYIGFAKVKKIESKGIKPVYDIEVEGNHNFIANGLIVHNSYITMLYPCSVLIGERASANHLNIAFGADKTWKDSGAKIIHIGKNTSSKILAKSISMRGGKSIYRGLIRINKGAKNAKSHVSCDALILDKQGSVSNTYPHNEINESTATFTHEATVNKINEEQLFYLRSRGLKEEEAMSLIVLGFLNDVTKEIPLEFAVEFSRLINLEMSKLPSVG